MRISQLVRLSINDQAVGAPLLLQSRSAAFPHCAQLKTFTSFFPLLAHTTRLQRTRLTGFLFCSTGLNAREQRKEQGEEAKQQLASFSSFYFLAVKKQTHLFQPTVRLYGFVLVVRTRPTTTTDGRQPSDRGTKSLDRVRATRRRPRDLLATLC